MIVFGTRLFALLVFVAASVSDADAATVQQTSAPPSRGRDRIAHSSQLGDWPQIGFDAGHSAYNPYETSIGPNNVAQLQQAWSFSTGAGNTTGNVVEAAGILYAPSANGTLFALDAASGQQLWSFASGTGYISSGSAAAIDSSLLFTICPTSGTSQGICALNAATGAPVWSYTFPGTSAYAGTAPVVAYNSVFFEGCAAAGCSYVALSEQTGGVQWAAPEPQGSCAGNGGITPAAAYRLLYVNPTCPTATANLLALRVKGGKTKWAVISNPPGGLSVADGIVAQVGQILTPSSEQLLEGFNAKTGDFDWAFNGGTWDTPAVPSMPAITMRFMYVVHNNYITGLTTNHGHYKIESYNNAVSSSWPSVANGVVYTACPGKPCAFDATSLTTLWAGPVSGTPTFGVPIVANGVLYGACQGSEVCAWTLPGTIHAERPQRSRLPDKSQP